MTLLKNTAEAQSVDISCNGEKPTDTEESDEECPTLVPPQVNGMGSDSEYFNSYASASVQGLMVRDRPRTEAYRRAILENAELFKDRVVLDVGAGSGILSLFAAEAGAAKVFAVEASPVVETLRQVIDINDKKGVIQVIHGKAEDISLPGDVKADILLSEWMGFYLLHESMLDSVILARERHLADDGMLFPSHATLYSAPVSLDSWVEEHITSWRDVYGYNMEPMACRSLEEKLASPCILSLSPEQLLSPPQELVTLDLRWVELEEVEQIQDKKFVSVVREGSWHGVALWFKVSFNPAIYDEEVAARVVPVSLDTGPEAPSTHWQQTVIPLLGDREAGTAHTAAASLEADEIIGWSVALEQSQPNRRQYRLNIQLLDPEVEEHPLPCHCRIARCELLNALLEKEEQDMQDLEEINS